MDSLGTSIIPPSLTHLPKDSAPNSNKDHRGKRSQKNGKQNQQSTQQRQATPPSGSNDIISMEETLKNDMNYLPIKTPVSVLQELLSRRGITPSYELVQIEGAIHEPTFRYRVSYNDKDVPFTAMGAGRSKKEAKHAAAKALIDKMTGNPSSDGNLNLSASAMNSIPRDLSPNGLGNGFDENVMGNPIGLLQEMCMARRWPPPTYETELEVGLPHERQFTISCTVLKNHEVGQGKSKKIAKRIAAFKMWSRLQESPLDQNQINQIIDEEGNEELSQRITNILNRYADLKDAHIPTLTNQHSYKVSQFHRTLKATFGQTLIKLQSTCLNDDSLGHVNLLQEIAAEHQFEVTYVDIEEKTYAGKCQCLVQLSTLPVAVCQGAGRTLKDAQANAARNALEYLKIMTKK